MDENFNVVVRIRPFLEKEIQRGDQNCLQTPNPITLVMQELTGNQVFDEYSTKTQFQFSNIAQPVVKTEEIFNSHVQNLLDTFREGVNATIMAYGLTNSGKTFTMFNEGSQRGIVLQSIDYLFKHFDQNSQLYVSYIQLYNEQLQDLLNLQNQIKVKITAQNFSEVENLSVFQLQSQEDIMQLLQFGETNRKTAKTNYNELSSRSHVILQLTYVGINSNGDQVQSKLNFVDLAGSERAGQSDLSETKAINKSLQCLGKVIFQLTDKNSKYISYRDSPLTKLLADSIGGNCRALLICCACSSAQFYYETLNTIRFAERAKLVVNTASINKVTDDTNPESEAAYQQRVLDLEKELNRLQCEKGPASCEELQLQIIQERRKQRLVEDEIQEVQLQHKIDRDHLQQLTTVNVQTLKDQFQQKKQILEMLKANNEPADTLDQFQQIVLKQQDNITFLCEKINERQLQIQESVNEFDLCANYERSMENEFKRNAKTNIDLNQRSIELKIQFLDAEVDRFEAVLDAKRAELNQIQGYNNYLSNLIYNPEVVKKDVLQHLQEVCSNIMERDKLQKYLKETNALIQIIKSKLMPGIRSINVQGVQKLTQQVLAALKESSLDF